MKLVELVGEQLTGQFVREADRQLHEIIERHRRRPGELDSGHVPAPDDDGEEQHGGDESRPGR